MKTLRGDEGVSPWLPGGRACLGQVPAKAKAGGRRVSAVFDQQQGDQRGWSAVSLKKYRSERQGEQAKME